jgi:hypothetical protein
VRRVRLASSSILAVLLIGSAVLVSADGTPQTLPVAQAWTDPGQLTLGDS